MATRISAGTQLGRYEIRSKIGEGGMGEVYLAQDTKLHRQVAIKLLTADAIANEQANKRLLREAQAAAKLDHPNICTVHEVTEESGYSFIVMPYVEGETLSVRTKRQPLELSESLTIATQVADALAEAHAHGIIHRDIKPSNIMITQRGHAKVMDFGLAKLSEPPVLAGGLNTEASTQALLTTPGTIIGTVPYMSPEQVHGQRLDARTDIFSFGVVLYEMLTGQQPFASESPAGTISAILTKEPARLEIYIAHCPAELQRIVDKCLQKNRERRYQTMRDVALDLETVRRECDGGFVQKRTPAKSDTQSVATVTDYSETRPGQLTLPRVVVAAAIVLIIVGLSLYALFFRRPQVSSITNLSVNSPAYDLYLHGKVNAGSENRENNESAIKLLEQATAADPNFAPAYAELARAYNVKSFYLASNGEKKKLNEDAEVAVAKALALDPDLAEAHFARGLILWTHAKGFPHEQAIQAYKRALALNPNLDEAHHQLALVYLHIGLLDKAEDEIKSALAINPNNTLARYRVGGLALHRGKYEEALAVYKTIPQEANPALWNNAVAYTLFQLGRTGEAASLVDQYLQTYPQDEGGLVTSVKAMLLAKAGKQREAEDAIQRAIDIGKGFGHFHHTAYDIAVAYALINKPEEALKWLQAAAEDGYPCYPFYENDFNLNSLRKDERFIAFMSKLKQQWEHFKATL